MRAIHHRPIYSRFYALAALGFLFGIVYGIFSLTLPILAGSIFANVATLGLVFALPELMGVFIDVPLGAFANRFGRRRTIFYSVILLAASALFFIFFKDAAFFILTLLLYEIATQAYIIPADAELMALSPPRRVGRFQGLAEGLHHFGFSIGPLLAGLLFAYSIDNPFWLSIGVCMAMMIVSLSLLPKEERRENLKGAIDHVWRRDHVFRAGFSETMQLGFTGLYLIFLFFIFALHWGFIALMEPLYTNELSFRAEWIGLIYAGYAIPFLFISMLVGRYIDRHDVKIVIVFGLMLIALSTMGFGLIIDPKLLFVLSLVSGAGDALLLPAVMAMIDRLSSYHKKEHISGVKVFAESGGYFLGPLIAGVAVQFTGFNATFIYFGIFLLTITVSTTFVPFRLNSK